MRAHRGRWTGALLCAAALAWGSVAEAVPARELLARAAAAEASNDLPAATRALEELVGAGVDSTGVLYDLGTLYARTERYGEAIWCLERAARRAPWSLSAQKNLRSTRLRLARRDAGRSGRAVVENSPPLRVQIGELLPLSVAVPLALLCELVVMGLWVVRRRTHNELGRVGATVGLTLALVGGAFLLGVVTARRSSPPAGVVLREGLRLLQSPRPDAIPDEAVREGERVVLAQREGEFVRVRTLPGRAGWLRGRDVGALGD